MNYLKKYLPDDVCKYIISDYLMPSRELVIFRKSICLHELKDWINICKAYLFDIEYISCSEYLNMPRYNYMYNLPRWRSYISKQSEPAPIELEPIAAKSLNL